MADIWQWKGDDSDGAGYVRILSGSSSIPITGTVTLASGSATIGVFSGNVTLAGSNFEQSPGSAIPAKGVLMGISDGTNLRSFTGNLEGALFASAARTNTTDTSTQTNYNAKGVVLTLAVTVAGATGGLTPRIMGVSDAGTAIYYNAAPTNITATGTYTFELYPGIGAASGEVTQSTSRAIPRSWKARIIHADTASYTYSLSYSLIL